MSHPESYSYTARDRYVGDSEKDSEKNAGKRKSTCAFGKGHDCNLTSERWVFGFRGKEAKSRLGKESLISELGQVRLFCMPLPLLNAKLLLAYLLHHPQVRRYQLLTGYYCHY